MNCWQMMTRDGAEAESFPNPAVTLSHQGELLEANWMSRLQRVRVGNTRYYIKSYASRGIWLRKYAGRSRARAEWENLLHFKALGISTVRVVAFGEQTKDGVYKGLLVTEELNGTRDLATLYRQGSELFRDTGWLYEVIRQLAGAVSRMHASGFIHRDLKWRNVLVDTDARACVHIIDCPQGRNLIGPLFRRGRVKDLACLDKLARLALTKSQRLRFYLAYKGKKRLNKQDKKELRRILAFFSGRD